MQLDLFEHSRDVMLRNDVVGALQRRDSVAAEKALAVLSAEFPDDTLRVPLTELSTVLKSRNAPFGSHDEALQTLDRMESVVVPAAHRVFGAVEATNWLVPVWRSMASEAQHLAFDADRPRAHAAPMLLAAADWTTAETTIKRIPSWRRIPIALAWMAEARFGEGGIDVVWPLLVELAWSNPGLFGELAGSLPDPRLRLYLQRFGADPELSADEADHAWFPAWLLIAEPALLPIFRGAMQHDNKPPERCARIVMELLISERQGGQRMDVEHRRRLRALHGGLFNRYMSTRETHRLRASSSLRWPTDRRLGRPAGCVQLSPYASQGSSAISRSRPTSRMKKSFRDFDKLRESPDAKSGGIRPLAPRRACIEHLDGKFVVAFAHVSRFAVPDASVT